MQNSHIHYNKFRLNCQCNFNIFHIYSKLLPQNYQGELEIGLFCLLYAVKCVILNLYFILKGTKV